MPINPYYTSAIALFLVMAALIVPAIGVSIGPTANAMYDPVIGYISERIFVSIVTIFSVASLCFVFVSILLSKPEEPKFRLFE